MNSFFVPQLGSQIYAMGGWLLAFRRTSDA
jgi:heme/copper-type cytochrome/quinol oxidase subunit 2